MLMELCRLSTVMMAFLVFAYIAWVDCRTLEIPDRCHLILIGLACVQMVCGGSLPLETRGLGLVAISLPMMLANLLRKDSFGGGDIKMCGAAGFLMGAPLMAAGALMGMLLAGLYAGFAVMLKIKKPKDAFALGPFLSIGFATSMLGGLSALGF